MHPVRGRGGTHVNNFAEFRLANGIPVDERLDVGDCELDRRAVHRIGNCGEVGLQADDKFVHCLIGDSPLIRISGKL